MSYKDPVPHEAIDPHEHLAEQELDDGGEHLPLHPHVTPFMPMFVVFIALLALTALTVWTSNLHGFWVGNTFIEIGATPHIMIAMGIAIVKALLVAAYFMHLLYDKKINTIVVASTIFALVLFLGLTLIDMDMRGLVSKDEVGEISAGGDLSIYKGSLREGVTGYQGGIVTATQEEGVAAAVHGDAPAADDPATDTAPGDGAATMGAEAH
jgi:caa(3)-type oxidase subunit IV